MIKRGEEISESRWYDDSVGKSGERPGAPGRFFVWNLARYLHFSKENGMSTDTEPQLLHGDCFTLLQKLPDRSVDLVLTDPPYNIGVNTQRNGKKL